MLNRNDLLTIVAEDLQYLKSDWDQKIDDPSIRRGSTVLRRLLVDGELQRAWRVAGFERQPLITCSTLRPTLREIPIERIKIATAGGAHCSFGELSGLLMVDYARTPGEIKARAEAGLPLETIPLKEFTEAPAIAIDGQIVARRVLIKYMANKLGGAHLDQKRGTSHEEDLYRRLDATRGLVIMDKPAVYFELLSVGQALAGADDVGRFLEKVSPQGAA